jgi:sensor c-di-GMP phosphodiesterase-like protein
VFVHRDLPIDATTHDPSVRLATLTPDDRSLRSNRGAIEGAWIDLALADRSGSCVCNGFVVVTRHSDAYATVAIVAVPTTFLSARTRTAVAVAVPLAGLVGTLLALAVARFAAAQRTMPNVVRSALRDGRLYLHYQPVVELATGRCVGAEALLRCHDASGDPVSPAVLVPAAEAAGMMSEVTQRVLELVANDVDDLFERHPGFHLAVNLAAADLASTATHERLERLRQRTGATRGNLIVEVTERELANTRIAREVVQRLREGGVLIAIDDFGTGYSNLAYLETFELDYLKIDKSFVDTLGTGAPTGHVVQHIIDMARDLDLELVAEGVETEAQAEALRALGVRYAQGWLYAKAMPFDDVVARLADDEEERVE